MPTRLRGLPVHIVHGRLDWMFPVQVARQTRDALSAAGADVTYRELDDLSHCYPREMNARDPEMAERGDAGRGSVSAAAIQRPVKDPRLTTVPGNSPIRSRASRRMSAIGSGERGRSPSSKYPMRAQHLRRLAIKHFPESCSSQPTMTRPQNHFRYVPIILGLGAIERRFQLGRHQIFEDATSNIPSQV